MEENDDESNKSDTEIINECEREMGGMLQWDNAGTEFENVSRDVEKRGREESEENSEEGFITFTRRRTKRLLRSNSIIQQNSTKSNINNNVEETQETENSFQICITSLTILPKQFAMAKLLTQENITNIRRIKYKSPNKALVDFNTKEHAVKLLNCPKITELGYRCQLTSERNISYGVIRGVDLDINIEEIKESLESPHEIISILRLKRLNLDGKWVDSESIRVGFKSSTLPSYVHAYGCRFKVETYEFPVTQCSMCWKFGHTAKFCPSKKVLCPKCGNDHDNCESTDYRCLNCKGPHMSLDKKCPIFVKEKKIRRIMREQNMTYRKALHFYLHDQAKEKRTIGISNINSNLTTERNNSKTYSSVLVTQADIHEDYMSQSNSTQELEVDSEVFNPRNISEKSKKKQYKKKKNQEGKKSIANFA